MSLRSRWLLILLALVLAWFGTLDFRKLVKPDEGRYAEIPREMVVTGDWLTPRLNGIKYFEKPPLQYWATATAFEAFGLNEWTARLWPALTGFMGILLAWFTGRRLFGNQAGILAGMTLASSFLYLAMGHINTLDMGLCFFLELAVCSFLLAQTSKPASVVVNHARRWMLLAWAALALAVLSKGIVALVLTGATLVLYSLLSRDWALWRRLELLRGLVLFFLIAAPWFIAVSVVNPEFPTFFFIHEHFERFLTKAHRRYQPAWYFIPILLLGALPWTSLALRSLWGSWKSASEQAFQPQRFLLLWCVVVFAFFSASGSKLPSYILPLFPALALLLGRFLSGISGRALVWHLVPVAALALVCLVYAPDVVERADEDVPLALYAAYADWLIAAASVWLASTLLAIGFGWRGLRNGALSVLAIGSFLAQNLALLGHESLSASNSAYHLAQRLKSILPADVPLFSVHFYDQTLPVYLQRTVILVNYRDEFSFGQSQQPQLSVPSMEEFQARWQAAADAFAIMEPDQFDKLQALQFPMTEVLRDTRRVVVRKHSS